MAGQAIREDDPATWPPLAEAGGLAGEPFTAAGSSPVLAGACDELIGPGRWTSPIACGGAVVVRFPSEDRASAGYHIEGSYDGPGVYWGAAACAVGSPGVAGRRVLSGLARPCSWGTVPARNRGPR